MGLTAGMYSGVSGLQTHGEQMSVIGNNIANVSTVGYKGSVFHFEDAISQEVSTSSGPKQVGRGVNVGTILMNFQQGSFETTTEATDVAIGGNGFFMVSPASEDINYYTRAGNFRFDEDGYLVDPHGYRVQGWLIDNTVTGGTGIPIVGVPDDVRLENFQSPPEATENVTMVTNLDSNAVERSTAALATDPAISMFTNWDGQVDPPLGATRYAYQSTLRVYDENGSPHDATVYYDPITPLTTTGGNRYWEYMVTVPPSEDGRTLDGVAMNTTDQAGVLMIGTLTFNAAGNLENISAFTLPAATNVTAGAPPTVAMSEWTPAEFSPAGYPICAANFLGVAGENATDDTADPLGIEINFGVVNSGTGWAATMPATAAALQNNPADLADAGIDPGDVTLNALASTNYSTNGSSTLFQSQDGYAAGFLQNVSIDGDGVLTGRYSNGQVLEHFALTLADFNNRWGLRREGGNVFSETRESGPPLTGLAGTGGLGSVASNSLEQSNVDMATEFVKMITCQRGFQANSKIIQTTDTMMGELIQLKR